MQTEDVLRRENVVLRERLSRLTEATLRIGEDLELDAVLREVLDAACSLTAATRGGMTLLDDSGNSLEFISSGLTEEEHQTVVNLPSGPEFFEYLTAMTEPLRVVDASTDLQSLGIAELPFSVDSFLYAPIRHHGRQVGNIYLGNKLGESPFTADDEETLSLFASQAAMAISNARRLQDEQRARADLETLIDTSPVGVVLFDAQGGKPLSINREARRIIDHLRDPDQTPEELLYLISYRRSDGRQLSVAEFPLTRSLTTGETVRGEEIVLQSPDGREVSTIINATPIHSDDGQVVSVVVTLQDLASLQQLEQMRADFLAMVSHELRAPLSSIKGSAATLVQSGVTLDPAAATQFHRIIEEQADHMQDLITDLLDVARIEAGTLAVAPQPVEIGQLIEAARSSLHSLAAGGDMTIDLPPDLPLVMADRRRISQVLVNLLSNAVRHSPDASPLHLSAQTVGVQVEIRVKDEGDGIPEEQLSQLFRKFSQSPAASGGSLPGSGLGLAICKGIVEAHGGRIRAESAGLGRGATFSFTLPATEVPGTPEPVVLPQVVSEIERGTKRRVRILAVDDDPQTLLHVRDALTRAGYEPILTGDPDAVGRLITERRPHLVLRDLMLPEVDGIELLDLVPELRELPVIFLSAYGGDRRIARALEHGADDYIVKPFSPTELVARIHTVLRRWTMSTAAEPNEPFVKDDLVVDFAARRVSLADNPVRLTQLEYRLLVDLCKHAGRVRTHAELLRSAWGPAHPGRSGAVRTVIKQLRRKLGDNADQPSYIYSEPRVGYRMAQPEPLDATHR
ncbi:MAG: response regulator [Chloroflexi bacterium]|nr:response regulator [Chloroflexota bacterium]